MKKIYIFIFVFAIIISVTGCSDKVTEKNMDTNAVFDTNLGVGIKLGMEKKDIDALLGDPILRDNDERYRYADETLLVTYVDEKAANITVSMLFDINKRWTIQNGIKIGTPKSEVEKYFNEEENMLFTSYYNKKGKIVNKDDSYDYVVRVVIFGEEIGTISINEYQNDDEDSELIENNLEPDEVSDTVTDSSLKLWMTKEEVDILLGDPTSKEDNDDKKTCKYATGVEVDYRENKICAIGIYDERWVIQHGIKVGTSKTDVEKYFDKTNGMFVLFYKTSGEKVTEEEADYYVSVIVIDNKVFRLTIVGGM